MTAETDNVHRDDVKRLYAAVTMLTERVSALESRTVEHHIAMLIQERDIAQRATDCSRQSTNQAEAKIAPMSRTIVDQAAEIDQLTARLTELESELGGARVELKFAHSDISDMRLALDQRNTKINALRDALIEAIASDTHFNPAGGKQQARWKKLVDGA